MASTYLNKTLSTPTNNYKWTLSVWLKKTKVGNNEYIFQTYPSGEGYTRLYFKTTDQIELDGEDTSAGNGFSLKTNRLFRDVSAWYHIVVKWDVTQSTATDRVKIYINGVEETSFATSNYPAQNTTYPVNRAKTHYIGRHSFDTNTYFNGYMSHYNFCDGYVYDASAFGSTDSDTGEWSINTSPSVTYGTNGFFILKDGNSVTDASPNSNNWTVAGGTLTKTEDCPSNVFATLNPLNKGSNITLSNGNLSYLTSDNWESAPSTLAVSSGKFYCEFKPTSVLGGTNSFTMFGVDVTTNQSWLNNYPGYTSLGYAYGWDGDKRNSGTNTSYGNSFSQNDIIGIALDMDNKKLYFHKNGTYQNSGVPTSGSTGTGAFSLTGDEYYFIGSGYNNNSNSTFDANFGNGYFGTTAVSSAGTNASGIGIFEFDVPNGFTALSTKGLNL